MPAAHIGTLGSPDPVSASGEFSFFLEGAAAVIVISFSGEESINALYRFEVVVTGLGVDGLEHFIGRRARLEVPGLSGIRVVHGVIAEQHVAFGADGDTHHFTVVPRLRLLGENRNSRVYQGLTVDRTVAEVLARNDVAHEVRLAQAMPRRQYCVQYEESDLVFVLRLLAEEGLCFFFEHEGDAELLVIADSATVHTPIPGGALELRDHAGALETGERHLTSFALRRRVAPTAVAVRSVDARRAAPRRGIALASPAGHVVREAGVTTASAQVPPAEAGGGRLEIYEHHDAYEDASVGAEQAARLLAQTRTAVDEGSGSSRNRLLRPGRTFQLRGKGEQLGEQVITRVLHRATSGGDVTRYENEFTTAPAGLVVRPPRPPRRVVQVVETAVVVGGEGEAIATEEIGCVRVQFPWDREGTHDARSSCWVRVMQPWSGSGHGFQFVPRIGAEVLVSFVGGDPDRPVVLGCLPGSASPLPYALPSEASKSGIRSRSLGGGGYSEIMFEDRAGAELLSVRAERDHEEVVIGAQRVGVGGAQRTAIGADRAALIGGDDRLEVGGSAQRRVAGDDLRAVGGAEYTKCGADRQVSVGGNQEVTVTGGSMLRVGGSAYAIIGTDGDGDASAQATGVVRVTGAQGVQVRSLTSIELMVGGSRIRIDAEGVSIDAPRVTVRSPEIEVGHDASVLRLGESIELDSDLVVAKGKRARLELAERAVLHGERVQLTGPAPRVTKTSDQETDGPREAVFKVRPPPGVEGPFTLRLAAPTGEVIELATDANHEVRLETPSGEAYTLLEVRSADRTLVHFESDG